MKLRPILICVPALALFCGLPAVAQREGPQSAPGGRAASTAAEARNGGENVSIERTAWLMGTTLRARVSAQSREVAIGALETGFADVERLERVLSSWLTDSEVGRLNATPAGVAVSLSAELAGLLAEAGTWVERTGGAFDPGVGALVDVWDLRGEGRWPAPDEHRAALQATGWALLERSGARVKRTHERWWLDTGGFGKGAALRRMVGVLDGRGVDIEGLDFGGQLWVEEAGVVGVAHPDRRDEKAVCIAVGPRVSVATTAASERFVTTERGRVGHVLDPRSGMPVAAWGSVTVVSKDAVAADVLSTALFVMGPEAGPEWATAQPDVAAVFLREANGRVEATVTDPADLLEMIPCER